MPPRRRAHLNGYKTPMVGMRGKRTPEKMPKDPKRKRHSMISEVRGRSDEICKLQRCRTQQAGRINFYNSLDLYIVNIVYMYVYIFILYCQAG